MVPRQHFDDPTTRRDVGAKESGRERVMQGWWGAPEFRVPTGRWHGKIEASQGQFDHGAKLEHLIQHTSIRSRAVVSWLYLRSVHFGEGRVRRRN